MPILFGWKCCKCGTGHTGLSMIPGCRRCGHKPYPMEKKPVPPEVCNCSAVYDLEEARQLGIAC